MKVDCAMAEPADGALSTRTVSVELHVGGPEIVRPAAVDTGCTVEPVPMGCSGGGGGRGTAPHTGDEGEGLRDRMQEPSGSAVPAWDIIAEPFSTEPQPTSEKLRAVRLCVRLW